MNLTSLIRKLESQLKDTEKLAKKYDAQADVLRDKLANVAKAIGNKVASSIQTGTRKNKAQRKKRKLSAAGRAKIIAAQRKRWAAHRGKSTSKKAAAPKKKRRLSAEGKAKIIAAQKARWAKTREKAI